MRAWERQEGESSRAYEAFALYRDMGPGRSITNVARELGKSRTLISRWSAAHDWVDRVEALEARDLMLQREALDEHLAAQAQDHAKRRAVLSERALEIAELAAQSALTMAKWPLSEQTYEQAGPDGVQIVNVAPARWSKQTIRPLFEIAVMAASGKLPKADEEAAEGVEFDFSELSEEELAEYIRISDKLGVKRKA